MILKTFKEQKKFELIIEEAEQFKRKKVGEITLLEQFSFDEAVLKDIDRLQLCAMMRLTNTESGEVLYLKRIL